MQLERAATGAVSLAGRSGCAANSGLKSQHHIRNALRVCGELKPGRNRDSALKPISLSVEICKSSTL
jgi:hypothetical protein